MSDNILTTQNIILFFNSANIWYVSVMTANEYESEPDPERGSAIRRRMDGLHRWFGWLFRWQRAAVEGGSGAPGWRRVRPENERNQRTFPPSLRDRRAGGGGGPFRRLRRPVSITLLALRAVRLINHLYKSPTQNAAKCHRKKQTRTKFDFVD